MIIYCLAKSSHLVELTITGVPVFMATLNVESWSLSSLRVLEIDVSKDSKSGGIKENVDGILEACSKSLTHLHFKGMEDWEWLPQSIQHLTNLSFLSLENLGIEEIPVWFRNLTSLKKLYLYSCKRLRSLPSLEQFINKLEGLSINDCPELHIHSNWPLDSVVKHGVRKAVMKPEQR